MFFVRRKRKAALAEFTIWNVCRRFHSAIMNQCEEWLLLWPIILVHQWHCLAGRNKAGFAMGKITVQGASKNMRGNFWRKLWAGQFERNYGRYRTELRHLAGYVWLSAKLAAWPGWRLEMQRWRNAANCILEGGLANCFRTDRCREHVSALEKRWNPCSKGYALFSDGKILIRVRCSAAARYALGIDRWLWFRQRNSIDEVVLSFRKTVIY